MVLLEMGFTKKMVEALLIHEDITDVNAAVELLMKGENGWVHRFRPDIFRADRTAEAKCQICGEVGQEHENVRN